MVKSDMKKLVDYDNLTYDEFGAVFRRMIEAPDLNPWFVKSAYLREDGKLVVESYVVNDATKTVVFDPNDGQAVIKEDILDNWKILQFDGPGKIEREIVASDCC